MLNVGLQNTNVRRRHVRRGVLLLLVVLALVSSLATRYVDYSSLTSVTSATSHGANAKRQHLDRDGFQWIAPVAEFRLFVASVSAPHVAPVQAPVPILHLDESLSNRPPPFC
jgi:hypothetical protein